MLCVLCQSTLDLNCDPPLSSFAVPDDDVSLGMDGEQCQPGGATACCSSFNGFPFAVMPGLRLFASTHTLCPRRTQSNYILWLKYGFGREAEFKYLLVRQKRRTGPAPTTRIRQPAVAQQWRVAPKKISSFFLSPADAAVHHFCLDALLVLAHGCHRQKVFFYARACGRFVVVLLECHFSVSSKSMYCCSSRRVTLRASFLRSNCLGRRRNSSCQPTCPRMCYT